MEKLFVNFKDAFRGASTFYITALFLSVLLFSVLCASDLFASGKCPKCGKVWNQPWAKSFKLCPDDATPLIEIEQKEEPEKIDAVRAITIKKINADFQNFYRRRVALCIGINNYPDFPTLEFAVKDAQDMAGVFRGYGFDDVVLLTNRDSIKEKIITELFRIKAESKENDLFVFYFAGHGTTAKDSRGKENGYLLTHDSDENNIHETGISMSLFKDICDTMPNKHILFLADCCYSGYGLTRSIPANEDFTTYSNVLTSARAVQLLSAGGKNDLAHERDGHGIFTSFLLEVLQGKTKHKNDGIISVLEMAEYIKQNVIKDTKGRQNPGFGYLAGNGDVIFIAGQQKRQTFDRHEILSLEKIESMHVEAESLSNKGDYLKAENNLSLAYADFLKHQSGDAEKNLRYIKSLSNLSLHMYKNDMAIYYAQSIIKDAANSLDKSLGYNQIGLAYDNKGEHDTAISYYKKALKIDIKELGPEHSNVATSYSNIGMAHSSKHEFDKAIEYFKKALKIDKNIYGESDSKATAYYNNLGGAYEKKGEFDKAIEYYKKALKIDLAVLGAEHPKIATLYNNLGLSYSGKGDFDRALSYYQRALKINLAKLGAEHPKVALRYSNIGRAYEDKGEFDKAIEYYKKALAIDIKHGGTHQYRVAIRYNNLGFAYKGKGDFDKAIEYYKKALEIKLEKLGDRHLEVANIYNIIGSVYTTKGEYNLAIRNHKKVLEIRKHVLGADHVDVATSYWWLGVLYRNAGINEIEANLYIKKAHAIYLKQLGSDHPKTKKIEGFLQ